MPSFRLSAAACAALREWNLKTVGRGITGPAVVSDPEVIERLILLSLPDETLSDTIIRLIHQGLPTIN